MAVSGFDLQGKKAVVVGAASPAGRVIALALAEAGAGLTLATCTRSAAEMSDVEACAADVARMGRQARSVAIDVTRDGDVLSMIDGAVSATGGLDILVNSIDVSFAKPLVDTTLEEWTRVLAANLGAVFLTSKHAARHMLGQGSGKIVNVTSMLGDRGLPNAAAYCAAQGGVVQLTKASALEWAPYGITVNGLGLGWMEGAPLAQEGDQEMKTRLLRYLPTHRLGRSQEIGALAVYLASEASAFMTGQTMWVDGGAMCHI